MVRYGQLGQAVRQGSLSSEEASDIAEEDNRQTQIQSEVAEATDQDEVSAGSDDVKAAIEAVTEEQVSDSGSSTGSMANRSTGSGGSSSSEPSGGSSEDKPLAGDDVDTKDPTKDRSGADQTGDPAGQAKQQIDALAQQFQDALTTTAEGDSEDDSADESGGSSGSEGIDRQVLLMGGAALVGLFVLAQSRGGN